MAKIPLQFTSLPTVSSALFMKLLVAVCLIWSGCMVAFVLRSGKAETLDAMAIGRRFIITISDGSVAGRLPFNEEADPALAVGRPVTIDDTDSSAIAPHVPAIQPGDNPIAEPSADLQEKTQEGILPKISAAKIKPWQYYSKAFKRVGETPLVFIVITGLGQNRALTEEAFKLNENFTLSINPYARNISSWATASRITGHETYVDLPMQLASYPANDPGPNALLLSSSNMQNMSHLRWVMSRFQGYAGVIAPIGEVISTNLDIYKLLVNEMQRRGLLFLASHEPSNKMVKDFLAASKAPILTNDVWLDEELSATAIQARLSTLEQTAERNGYAIGIAQAYPISLEQLKLWQETLATRGVALAPLSFYAKLKYR